jgi:MerR family mercuric resistance operon transcriptional regulator
VAGPAIAVDADAGDLGWRHAASSEDPMMVYKLSALAKACGISAYSIRNYQTLGLIQASARTRGGHYLYDKEILARLKLIRVAREAGLSLQEIQQYLAALDTADPVALQACRARLQEHVRVHRARLGALAACVAV